LFTFAGDSTAFLPELNALWVVTAMANWVALHRTNQFAVAVTNHGAFISDKIGSVEMRSDEMIYRPMNSPRVHCLYTIILSLIEDEPAYTSCGYYKASKQPK